MSEELGALQDQTFARATKATAESFPPERRLTAGELADYLDRRSFAVLGTVRPDGRPHAAMSSYVRRGATIWLPTVAGSVRERNLRGQSRMTMVVTEGDNDEHIVVQLEGPAEVVPLADAPAEVRDLRTGEWVSSWIRLQPESVLSYAAESALG